MDKDQMCCPGCSAVLMEPYICCAECGPPRLCLCLNCFAKGYKRAPHQNYHRYEVIKNDFVIFEEGWTAVDERRLLDAVADCGVGNWMDVAKQMRNKNRHECERHYMKCYISNPPPEIPAFPEPEIVHYPCPMVYKLSEDPPRPSDGSLLNQEMSGYMPARGDFTVEYDNHAEHDLKDMDFPEDDDQVIRDLKVTVLEVYHSVLKERARRKRIIRKFGLINIKKNTILGKQYEKHLSQYQDGLRVFTRLLSPLEFDKYLAALNYEGELRQQISELQELRQQGLRRLQAAHVYYRLKASREDERLHRHHLGDVVNHLQNENACQQWLQRQAVLDNISKGLPLPLPSAPRKSAPPLDIVGMPGYDRLSSYEKELCALVRLVPDSYNEFKKLLIAECNKQGYLKLAQARTMIKIDVNKTRKIYDFLCEQGILNKDPLSSISSSLS